MFWIIKNMLYTVGEGEQTYHFLYKGWDKHFNILIHEGGNKYFSTQWWGDKHFLYTGGDKCFYPRRGVGTRRGQKFRARRDLKFLFVCLKRYVPTSHSFLTHREWGGKQILCPRGMTNIFIHWDGEQTFFIQGGWGNKHLLHTGGG